MLRGSTALCDARFSNPPNARGGGEVEKVGERERERQRSPIYDVYIYLQTQINTDRYQHTAIQTPGHTYIYIERERARERGECSYIVELIDPTKLISRYSAKSPRYCLASLSLSLSCALCGPPRASLYHFIPSPTPPPPHSSIRFSPPATRTYFLSLRPLGPNVYLYIRLMRRASSCYRGEIQDEYI